jgi:hypothetical protein
VALTQAKVIEVLQKTGRTVEARTLTDWRARGILPSLTTRGLGQGKGRQSVWEAPDILDRIAFVYDLRRIRTEKLKLALWCCGFEVPLEHVRSAWAETIERLSWSWARQQLSGPAKAGQSYFDELDDRFQDLSRKFAREKNSPSDIPQLDEAELTRAALFVVFAKTLPRDIQDELAVLEKAFEEMYKKKYEESVQLDLAPAAVIYFRKFASPIEIKRAVENSSDIELRAAMSIWKQMVRAAAAWLAGANKSPELGFTIGRRFAATFGPLTIGALLVVVRSQAGNALTTFSQLCELELERFEVERRLSPTINAAVIESFMSSIGAETRSQGAAIWNEIWSGLNRLAKVADKIPIDGTL